ncbi:MAG: PAS domain S-box protein [Deltaproteobacteria bacterium]
MSGRQILVFIGLAIAIGTAWLIMWRSPYGWLFYVLGAGVCGLAAGIVWEHRRTGRLAAENEELKRQAERQAAELARAKKLSGELQLGAAQALRDSEALYHSLVDHLPLSVLRKDRDGKYTFVNRRYLEFSKKESADILGTTDFDLFPQELATKYRAGDEQVLKTGELFEDVEAYRKSDGEVRYIQVLKTPVRDADQRIIGTQVMFWDVTDRHRAEEAQERFARELEDRNAALQESEDNLQRQTDILMSILNSIADGVVVADENGRFVLWNPAADRIIGLGPMDKPTAAWPQVYGLYQTDGVTPFPAEQVPLARAIRGETVSGVELFVRNKARSDGVTLSVNGSPLTDPEGRIKGGVVVFRDVTESNAAREALRLSEERARQIVETAYDPFVSIDSEGRVREWNTQAQTTFGWKKEEVLGKILVDLIIPTQYRAAHTAGIRRYLETGVGPVLNARLEITALHRDGHEFPVELTVWAVHAPNGCCFNAFVHDITRRKAAEAEIRSKNQDLETLLYVTSHDLREPLRAIENFSRLVCERYADKLDAKGQDFLSRVVQGARRLDLLIEDVLTLSRVQRTVQPTEDIDSGEIVADVLRHLEARIRETGAVVNVADGLPAIRADRRWATQAVQNLVSNALKYTVEGEAPQVEIGGFRGPEGVGLVVRDRGLGVPPDYAERIFQLFQRAVSRKIEGTGAGLAIVKRVAERHGGQAWVRPREGGGSEFIITFGPGAAA